MAKISEIIELHYELLIKQLCRQCTQRLSATGGNVFLHPCQTAENSHHPTSSQDGSPWILSVCLWTKGNGMNWPCRIQYAKGSFFCAGISKSFAATSSFFEVGATKKHLKRQTKDLFSSKLLKLSALKLCHKAELTSPSYPHKF